MRSSLPNSGHFWGHVSWSWAVDPSLLLSDPKGEAGSRTIFAPRHQAIECVCKGGTGRWNQGACPGWKAFAVSSHNRARADAD
jgi:hypothetical protein